MKPRGQSVEVNALVEMVRSWLDKASVNVAGLHGQLVPEHFQDGKVPPLHKLRARLNGEGIDWDLVEAVADVCIPQEEGRALLGEAKDLWLAAQSSPTPLGPNGGEVTASHRDVVAAQELALSAQQSLTQAQQHALEAQRELSIVQGQAIDAYQELNQARQALEASEHGRQQALQIGTVVFAMLGTTQATVRELERRIDAKQTWPAAFRDDALDELRVQLQRAEAQERDLREQLARSERDRVKAQQVADFTARRIQVLEVELLHYKELTGAPQERGPSLPRPSWEALEPVRPMYTGLDDMDHAIERVRSVLDHEHDAVEEAAEEIGWRAALEPSGDPAEEAPAASSGLFQTTPNNPPPGHVARLLELAQQTADQAIAEGREEANRLIAQARARLQEAEAVRSESMRALEGDQTEGEVLARPRREDLAAEIRRLQEALDTLESTEARALEKSQNIRRPSWPTHPSAPVGTAEPESAAAAGAAQSFAERLATQEQALGPDHPETLTTKLGLTYWLGESGDAAGAARAYAELLAAQKRVLGPDDPETLTSRAGLAYWLGESGDTVGAARAYAELLAAQKRVLGPDDPETLTSRAGLAYWLGESGIMAGATRAYAELLAAQERILGPDRPETLTTREQLASLWEKSGDTAGAVRAYTELLAAQERVLGFNHPEAFDTREKLAYWRKRGEPQAPHDHP